MIDDGLVSWTSFSRMNQCCILIKWSEACIEWYWKRFDDEPPECYFFGGPCCYDPRRGPIAIVAQAWTRPDPCHSSTTRVQGVVLPLLP